MLVDAACTSLTPHCSVVATNAWPRCHLPVVVVATRFLIVVARAPHFSLLAPLEAQSRYLTTPVLSGQQRCCRDDIPPPPRNIFKLKDYLQQFSLRFSLYHTLADCCLWAHPKKSAGENIASQKQIATLTSVLFPYHLAFLV